MRRSMSPGSSATTLSLRSFGWDPAQIAVLSHSTLPWRDAFGPELAIDGVPLDARKWAARDALSLLAQYAAHLGFLRFAGVRDVKFDPAEWRVVSRRASDVRLLRIAASRPAESEDVVTLDLLEGFSEAVSAPPLETLSMGWASPEQVYCEIHRLLEGERADLQWFRLSAGGLVLAPGAESLRDLAGREKQVFEYADDLALSVTRDFASLLTDRDTLLLGGETVSPLSAGSAFPEQYRGVQTVEKLLERSATSPLLILVSHFDRWDEQSRHLLDLLREARASWFVPSGLMPEASSLVDSRLFAISPTVRDLRSLQKNVSKLSSSSLKAWLEVFLSSPDLDRFLRHGSLPSSGEPDTPLQEPLRSYLSALAVLGNSVATPVATRFLANIGCRLPLSALPGSIIDLSGDRVTFVSREVQRQLARSLAEHSARALVEMAAPIFEESGDLISAARLLLNWGQSSRAQTLLDRIDWESLDDESLMNLLGAAQTAQIALLPMAGPRFARGLLSRGRYREGKLLAAELPSPTGEVLMARFDRRTGDYEASLSRLMSIDPLYRCIDSHLLEAELHRLRGDYEASGRALDAIGDVTSRQHRAGIAYHRCLLAFDTASAPAHGHLSDLAQEPYLALRVETYRQLAASETDAAIISAQAAVEAARSIPDAIDASLDLVYSLFTAGEWDAARLAARNALSMVEEAEGDRAAAGILFTLSYLCADSAQFGQAEQILTRLRRFYSDRNDARRARELDVPAAQLELGRGQFERVRRLIEPMADVPMADDLREAAALAHDEALWILGSAEPIKSRGLTANRELQDRHLLQLARRDPLCEPVFTRPFYADLHAFEREWLSSSVAAPTVPTADRMSDILQLHRSLTALSKRRAHPAITAELQRIAAEHGLGAPLPAGSNDGYAISILSAAVTAPYPFAPASFEVDWEFASRNRLGRWTRIGSHESPEEELNDHADSLAADWTKCSDRSLLYVAGSSLWPQQVRDAVAEAFAMRASNERLKRLLEEPEPIQPSHGVEGVLGESPIMRELTDRIRHVARSDAPVCIEGESGTGKELLARAVHLHSTRKSKRFTAINCAAIPENLLESELFGTARGAFTGADRDRAGLIEVTDGGTLFLDEIGELPLPAQAKVLRFIQEGEFRRVGDTNVRHSDVRIVSATNRLLEQAVEEGSFRQDLYFRIHVVEVTVPPLRERGGDVLLLARAFLKKERETLRGGPGKFSDEAESLLLSYRWPGNVRELQNTVKAAVALAGTEARHIDVHHLPARLQGSPRLRIRNGSYNEEIVRFRRDLIERSLAESAGNQNQAAKKLGMSRQALAYQIRELGILVRR
ncbi:MAG TPA: sigma 54-interacting transcriptional regulator [Thermoanaerobaculia bacterium]|nr:sigma 54-interacting transcriptional regulator [Thermoanaerobaculia bacterium]